MRRAATLGLVVLVVAGSLAVLAPAPRVEAAGEVSVYMGGLSWPTALAFASDGRIFFAERLTGSIRIIEGGLLLATPFITLAGTTAAGERGLLGLALDPGFPSTPYVYAYHTYDDTTNGTIYNRIVRITASGNVGVSFTVILRLPALSGATNHNGGVIAFGPDGKLFVDVGENADIALAQNLMSPMGKVLRMNPDGSPPADNPYYGSLTTDNLIYTYGHRNMFGLAFHPVTGRVYVTENGPGCNDEVNLLPNLTAVDRNFGWGTMQRCSTPPPPPQNTNLDGPNPIPPIWWWGPTICPTNAAIYGGPYFPAFRGDMFMGDCNTGRLHRLHLVPPGYDTVASDSIVYTAPTSIIEVEEGPDGAIWFTTPSTIYRYWDSGQPPVASFTATPNPVPAGSPVAFDASASSDPDGTITSYAWEFGDAMTGTGITASHAYAAAGTYRVNLTVIDNETFTATSSVDVRVIVPPSPPVASFTADPNPTNVGTIVSFDGTASYDPDGTITSYAWNFGDTGTASGVTASHAYDAAGTYRVNLTVTDDSFLTDFEALDVVVWPRPVLQPPIAGFFANPNPVNPGVAVTFDAAPSYDPDGTITSYAWTFGDTSTGTDVLVSHAYALPGQYFVTLTVTDNTSLNGSASQFIDVNGPPHAAFVYAPLTIYIGVVVTFNGSGSSDDTGVTSWSWAFGDTRTGTGVEASHTYGRKGTFLVTLIAGDALGLTNSTTMSVQVRNRAPQILSSDPAAGPARFESGATRRITVIATDPDTDPLTYVWRIDGVPAGGNASTLDFLRTPGTYAVNVTVSDGSLATWREWTVTLVAPGAGANVVLMGIGFSVIAVALVLIALLASRRRRQQEAEKGPRRPPNSPL